jgi:FlaA1/EpsC-like NDP-sugar epimerase
LIESFTIPISVILIHYLVSLFVLILSRYIFKAFYEILSTELNAITNVLIYGAGDSGIITYGALNTERKKNYDVLGFVDDNPSKINKKIDRIKIYSPEKINKEFIDKFEIDEIIISIQNIKPSALFEITDTFSHLDVGVKIVPPLTQWIEGTLQANQIRQINIDDLLDRQQIRIDNPIVNRDVDNKVVLVTGAAGSIGGELSRQLASYNLKKLILIDQAESPLYDLQQELIQQRIHNFEAIIADVRDKESMQEIFEHYQPHKVFHAAAYKHVP